MATRERLALTSNIKKHKYLINGHERTPGSIEQYGIPNYGINKFSINGHKRTPGSKEQYKKTQIFNKWPQENAWLKRAIWKTEIINKWPQEKRLARTSNMKYNYSTNGQATRTPGSNEQYGTHKYSINGHKRAPGSNEQ